MTSVKTGDKEVEFEDFPKFVVDSGTSLTMGPQAMIDALEMPEVAQDCSNLDSLPDITFTLDDVDYVMAPTDYVLKIESFLGDACINGIMGAEFPEGFNYLIVGDNFFRGKVVYFDQTEPARVGFAT